MAAVRGVTEYKPRENADAPSVFARRTHQRDEVARGTGRRSPARIAGSSQVSDRVTASAVAAESFFLEIKPSNKMPMTSASIAAPSPHYIASVGRMAETVNVSL